MRLTLGQVAEVRLGRQRSPEHEVGDHPARYLRSANVVDGRLDLSDVKTMNFNPAERLIFSLEDGDVLVTEGSGSIGTVGTSAVWRGDLPGVVCFQNTLLRLRPRVGLTSGRYLAWWARHARVSGQIAAISSGANIKHVGSDGLKRLPLWVPTIEEQRRIADFLDERVARIDRIIASRQDQVLTLQQAYESWLHTAFEDAGSEHGFAPLRRFDVRIEQGWSPLADSVPADGGQPGVLKLGAVRAGEFRPAENKAMLPDADPQAALRVEPGDLLVTRANTAQLVGDAAVARGEWSPVLYLSDLIYRLRIGLLDHGFASAALRSPRSRQLIAVVARGTSGSMPKLRGEDLLGLPIPRLPSARQEAFGAADLQQRERRDQRISQLKQSTARLQEYKQSLITAAVTGELDVTTAGSGVPG